MALALYPIISVIPLSSIVIALRLLVFRDFALLPALFALAYTFPSSFSFYQ